jgi:tetratricopeptide (TPR) repeat protein
VLQLTGILYLAGFCIFAARLLLGMVLVHGLNRRARPDDRGFYFAQCTVPLTLGIINPRILMPASAEQWDAKKLSCILIHEREHVRRLDPLVEWLALINRSLYWFHPLAWWLQRKLAVLAEEACDEAVIVGGTDAASYAELLLDMARSVKQRGILDANWGLSIQGGALMKRIQNILADTRSPKLSQYRLSIIMVLCIAAILVPVVCKLIPAQEYPSQNAVYLTSKAISAEDNDRNLDNALAYYRQVLTTPSDQRIYAAFAQFRIAQIMLQKGNLAEAAQEFDFLAKTYPEYADLVRTSIAQDHSGVFHSPFSLQNSMHEIGDIRDIRYHHNLTGSEFSLQDWSLAMQSASSGGGEIVLLQNKASNALQVRVWMKPDRIATEDIPSWLRGAVQEKVIQRIPARGYRVRPDSIQFSTINGKQALSAIADYVEDDNTAMAESLTWIYTERARVFFFARIRASHFNTFKPSIDRLVETAVIP